MAQTWPVTHGRRAALAFIDLIGYTLTSPRRWLRRQPSVTSIRRILVIEPWNIGDVVLATPLLAELRRCIPGASVTILGRPHATEILRGSGLVDEVLEVEIPWTRQRRKYSLSTGDFRKLVELGRTLRRGRYDLTLDARGDIRNNFLAAVAGAPRRIGYDVGGGWMLTDALETDQNRDHRIVDWLRLLEPLGYRHASTLAPQQLLRVSEEEVTEARQALAADNAVRRPIVGYHPGASHPGKRWPLERFAQLSSMVYTEFGGSLVVFADPGGHGHSPDFPKHTVFVETGLRGLMASLKCCDVLICNDSGPMHLADGLGVPVVAVFENGNPQWYGPSGPNAIVVNGEKTGTGISARPMALPPQNPVAVDTVHSATSALLRNLGFERR